MKVRELAEVCYDKIIIYKQDGENYVDLFKGESKEIPNNILNMEIEIVGSKRKNVLDIMVK